MPSHSKSPKSSRFGPNPEPVSLEDTESQQDLSESLLPVLRQVAIQVRKRLPNHIELEELMGMGALGLLDAMKKFDPNKGVSLKQYAVHRIRGAIIDGLRELDCAPRGMRSNSKRAESAYSRLEARLGRAPSDDEMATGLGLTVGRWNQLAADLQSLGSPWLSPWAMVGMQESPVCEDSFPADNAGHQFDACYLRERREILECVLRSMPLSERQVVELYYYKYLKMREIGERLGIGESRVSQLRTSALDRLRRRVKAFLSGPNPFTPQFTW